MKFLRVFLICLSFAMPALAQPSPKHGQQIESVKIAYITRRLELSPEEARRFWPVYNNYQKEINEVLRQKRAARLNNDKNADDRLAGELNFEESLLNIRKKYQKEFTKVIPSEKVLLLYQAEREFREQLIRQLRERRKN